MLGRSALLRFLDQGDPAQLAGFDKVAAPDWISVNALGANLFAGSTFDRFIATDQ